MVYCIECLLAILVIISIYNIWSKPFKISSFKENRHRLVESLILNLDCYLHCVRIPFVCSWSSIWIFLKSNLTLIFSCVLPDQLIYSESRLLLVLWEKSACLLVIRPTVLSFIILYSNKKILESYKTRLVSEVSSPIASC